MERHLPMRSFGRLVLPALPALSALVLVGMGTGACASLVGADFDHDDSTTLPSQGASAGDRDSATGAAIDPVEEPVAPGPDGSCPTTHVLCGELCVSKADPDYGCGAGCTPCSIANGAAGCSAGKCVVASCSDGYRDCGGTCKAEGPVACGASCTVCDAPPNAVATCNAGTCGFECAEGYIAEGDACVVDDPTAERIVMRGDVGGVLQSNGTLVYFTSSATRTGRPGGPFRQVSVINRGTVDSPNVRIGGVRTNEEGAYGGFTDTIPFPGEALRMLKIEYDFDCALRTDGTLVCAGTIATPPTGTFRHMAISLGFGCAVRTDGTLACWGTPSSGRTEPPAGTFRQISLMNSGGCGLRTDRTIACWGGLAGVTPPAGTFRYVSVGYGGSMAVRMDGTIQMWSGAANLTPPTGTFRQVAVGSSSACAIATSGALACWGSPLQNPTSGTYW